MTRTKRGGDEGLIAGDGIPTEAAPRRLWYTDAVPSSEPRPWLVQVFGFVATTVLQFTPSQPKPGEDRLKRLGFRSLRIRFVIPHLIAAIIAAASVALISSSLGRQWALRDVYERFEQIKQALDESAFPLTGAVLTSVADLTGTELITFAEGKRVQLSTLELTAAEQTAVGNFVDSALGEDLQASPRETLIELKKTRYLAFQFSRSQAVFGGDRVRRVLVLCDAEGLDAAGQRAALLPLATGLSSILILLTLMLVISGRLVRRLIHLQQGVERVAAGDFDFSVSDASYDEVGQLGQAVDKMAVQLKQLWSQVNRQQSEKLLHLIAAGMAHQLRNTLTGARMAIELHAQRNAGAGDNTGAGDWDREEVDVAIRELDVAEDYVRRLLLVSAGKSETATPETVHKCLQDVYASHAAVAKHLRVKLDWHDPGFAGSTLSVADGSAFTAAISNLVLNAMQASDQVKVEIALRGTENSKVSQLVVRVLDHGVGIAPAVLEDLFEPFVTSKPEGMGLGLPLVRRSAEQLGGNIDWRRESDWTVFEFQCQVFETMERNAEADMPHLTT